LSFPHPLAMARTGRRVATRIRVERGSRMDAS
jgi:hypothetical protein